MVLVQIFLPLRDNRGRPIGRMHYERLIGELSERFLGVTVYARAPATGLWKKRREARAERDDMVIVEVMAPRLERRWWRNRRMELQATFRQREILIRSFAITRL